MAVYRPIQISFWQKKFILKLTPEQKYFYIYLLTNSKTSQCGIYELPIRVIELETDYNHETVTKLLENFIQCHKIKYDYENEEIYILNWLKYNKINNENVSKCVISELKEVKNDLYKREFLKNLSILNENNNLNDAISKGLKGAYKGLPSKQTETQTEEESKTPLIPFDMFWQSYDKKRGDKSKLERMWNSLTDTDRQNIMDYIPKYKIATPDKKYRKDPQTFFNNKSWNDELIGVVIPKPEKKLTLAEKDALFGEVAQ